MTQTGLIDYSSRPPVRDLTIRAPHISNYDRIHGGRGSETGEDFSDAALRRYFDGYEAVNARKVVIKARDIETTFSEKIRNEDVAAFCRENGDRFIGFAGVDPHKGMAAV